MGALKLVMMAVVLVALLGASPPTVEARTSMPTILTTSESLENIDLDTVFVDESSDEISESNILPVVESLGVNDEAGNPVKCGGVACCNVEICTRSCPPQCRCMDKGAKCHAACKNCKCTKSKPRKCQCMDVTHYTHGKCK